jgi:transmembrane sensor
VNRWFGKDTAGRSASRWFARLHRADVSELTDREFGRWLNRDSRNEEEFERRELLWELLGEIQDDPDILQVAPRPPAPAKQPQARLWLKWSAAAAALSVLAVGYWQFTARSHRAAPTIQDVTVTTETGQEKQIVLADGSRVLLNTATRLRVRLTRRVRRLVLENGEAVFLVRHDSHWPFTVIAGRTSTHDVGTAFDVLHLAGQTNIAVMKGRVLVDASSSSASHQQVALTAGQATAYTNVSGLGPIRAADLSRIAAWQRHRVEFHDETLASAVSDFNRYIAKQIVIGDPSVAGIRVSGVFRCDDASAFVRALYGTFGIRAQPRGNSIVLLPGTGPVRRPRSVQSHAGAP